MIDEVSLCVLIAHRVKRQRLDDIAREMMNLQWPQELGPEWPTFREKYWLFADIARRYLIAIEEEEELTFEAERQGEDD